MDTQRPTPNDAQPLLCPAEAARLANVSPNTIRREIDRGSVRALHVGARLLRIDPAGFDYDALRQQFADEMLSLLTLSDEQAAANTEQRVQIASFEG